MKFLLSFLSVIALLLMSACSSDSDEQEVVSFAKLYSYEVFVEGQNQPYSGEGVFVNGILYTYSTMPQASPFVVTAEIIDDFVKIFDYNRDLILYYNDTDETDNRLIITEISDIREQKLENFDGQWFNQPNIFDSPVLTINYQDGIIQGVDTDGCVIDGEIFELDGVMGVTATIKYCDIEGDYDGSLHLNSDGEINGAISSGTHSIPLHYKLN